MSDRYETPRWDDEPDELPAREDRPSDDPIDEDPLALEGESDLDASSENVLEGWPVADPRSPTGDDEPASDVDRGVDDRAPEPSDGETAVAALAEPASVSAEHAPGELTVPPGYAVLEGEAKGENRRVGIVVARFNGDVTTALLESALEELDALGVARDSITVLPVPGAFELPLAAMALAKTRRFSCIVALGCVIRGDTPHFDYVSSEAASGLQLAAIETGVPVAFGVLTLDRADQAESRTQKGAEAVHTGLEMADLFANLRAAAAR